MTNTPDKSELLPCPFCGSDYVRLHADCVVQCVCCSAEGPVYDAGDDEGEGASRLWNTRSRPPADQVPDMVERLLSSALNDLDEGLTAALPTDERAWLLRRRFEGAQESIRLAIAALQAVPASEVGWRNRCEHLMACIDYSNEAAAPPDELDPEDIALIDETRAALQASGEE